MNTHSMAEDMTKPNITGPFTKKHNVYMSSIQIDSTTYCLFCSIIGFQCLKGMGFDSAE